MSLHHQFPHLPCDLNSFRQCSITQGGCRPLSHLSTSPRGGWAENTAPKHVRLLTATVVSVNACTRAAGIYIMHMSCHTDVLTADYYSLPSQRKLHHCVMNVRRQYPIAPLFRGNLAHAQTMCTRLSFATLRTWAEVSLGTRLCNWLAWAVLIVVWDVFETCSRGIHTIYTLSISIVECDIVCNAVVRAY